MPAGTMDRWAAERAAVMRRREENTSRFAAATDLNAVWAQCARRVEHQRRAYEAYATGRRAPRPARADFPAPAPSRQWAAPMETAIMRDRRVPPAAAKLLAIIVAECGGFSSRLLTNGYLAVRASYSPRHIQRLCRELERCGYISTEPVYGPTKLQVSRRIHVSSHVMAYWHLRRRQLEITAVDAGGPLPGIAHAPRMLGFPGTTDQSSKNDSYRTYPRRKAEIRHSTPPE